MSMINLYVSDKSKRFFARRMREFKLRDDMKIRTVPNGVVAVNTKTMAYGVLDANGRFVPECRCWRGKTSQFVPHISPNDDIEYCDCDAVFCADAKQHFGHFLLEGMPRTYPGTDKKYKNAKFVFVSRNGAPAPQFLYELVMGLACPRENILVLTRPMRFRNVFVPDQAFNIPYWSSPMVQKTYTAISDFYSKREKVKKFDKIYVSRGAMPARRTFGEAQIAKIFKKNGFQVIYPETLPLSEQIAIMSHCRVLAGCAGTALHLSLFMKPGGHIIQIKRNSRIDDNCGVQNMINQTFDFDFTYIAGSVETCKTGHYTECPQIIGPNEYMKQFFDDVGFKYTARDIAFDKKEFDEYTAALAVYQAAHGGTGMIKIKRKFVKIISCFVPGRVNRNRFRGWLKHKLGLK